MIVYSLSSSNSPDLIRYIGYTKKPIHIRLREHISNSRYNKTHKDKWIKKEKETGNEIKVEILAECMEVSEAKRIEILYISTFKSFGAKLVNGTMGGDGVSDLRHSEQFKKRNSEIKSKKVYCFDFKTKRLLAEFSSGVNCVKEMRLTPSSFQDTLAGKKSNYKGFTFSLENEFPSFVKKPRPKVWNKGIKIADLYDYSARKTKVTIEKYNQIINFDSVKDVCEYFKIKSHSIISKAISSKKKYKGFIIYKQF